jgi:hypothetical protein
MKPLHCSYFALKKEKMRISETLRKYSEHRHGVLIQKQKPHNDTESKASSLTDHHAMKVYWGVEV